MGSLNCGMKAGVVQEHQSWQDALTVKCVFIHI
jgi:hypothetical protein